MLDRIIDILHGFMCAGFLVSGVFFCVYKSEKRAPRRLRIIMGATLLFIALEALSWILISFLPPLKIILQDNISALMIDLLLIPFCTSLLRELTRQSEVTWRDAYWQVGIPLTLTIIYCIQLYMGQAGSNVTFIVYLVYLSAYSSYYLYHCINSYHRYQQVIGDIYSDVRGRSINWLKNILIIFASLLFFCILLRGILNSAETSIIFSLIFIIFGLVVSHFVGWMRDTSLVETEEQRNAGVESYIPEESNANNTGDERTKKDVDLESDTEYIENIRNIIISQKLYANNDLNRDDVARAVGTNHRYLAERMKEVTGMTFSQYICDLRLLIAGDMLKEGDESVESISETCGFGQRATFYRAFTRKYGCTPIAFRNNEKT